MKCLKIFKGKFLEIKKTNKINKTNQPPHRKSRNLTTQFFQKTEPITIKRRD